MNQGTDSKTPDYSEMSREQLERHCARMAQALADDKSRAFWHRYALGPMRAPSCLCCGQLPEKIAIQHMELPGIVVCEKCRNASLSAQAAPPARLLTPLKRFYTGSGIEDSDYARGWNGGIQACIEALAGAIAAPEPPALTDEQANALHQLEAEIATQVDNIVKFCEPTPTSEQRWKAFTTWLETSFVNEVERRLGAAIGAPAEPGSIE